MLAILAEEFKPSPPYAAPYAAVPARSPARSSVPPARGRTGTGCRTISAVWTHLRMCFRLLT